MFRLTFALLTLSLTGIAAVQAQDAKWTTIKGQVILDGKVPAPTTIQPNNDGKFCTKDGPILTEVWQVSEKSQGVKNIFVWIEPDITGRKRGDAFPQDLIHPDLAKAKVADVTVDQPCCQFVPHVLAVRTGQNLIIKNSAAVPHNAKFDSRNNGSVNPLLAPNTSHKIEDLKAEKFPVEVACNIHSWMKAWVRVYDHPYFAVTDSEGNFEIKNAPQGKFKLYYWHETGWNNGAEGSKGYPVEIKGETLDLGAVKFKPAS
jgi:hypothetical protein